MTQPTSASKHRRGDPEETSLAARMSFGDHLEELRSCLIRALLGVVLTTGFTLYFGRTILEIIYHPLLVVQFANGLQPQIQVLSPTGAFSAYLKIGFFSGLIFAMPWVLHQAWTFVATGLYSHERRFVKMLVPVSALLFALGVLFLYYIVLPIVLNFFVRFNEAFTVSSLTPTGFSSLLLPVHDPEMHGAETPLAKLPLLSADPVNPQDGDTWVNAATRRLIVKTPDGLWSMPMQTAAAASSLQSQFALDYYISFVLMLALAFGLAFESPLVVLFLAWSGLVPVETMAGARRYILLGVVVIAAVITPPDVLSQLLLAIPMYGLFEIGLLAARVLPRSR